jgi:ABC-type branched-subunit amino acid transport system ATPase component
VSALSLHGISKAFGGVQAVADCTLTVQEGSVTGLIGPNGAGKSTVVDLITGFARPDEGEIQASGTAITGWAPNRIAALGVIRTFQAATEWPSLSTFENLLVASAPDRRTHIWRSLLRIPADRSRDQQDATAARQILARVGLTDLKDAHASHLSSGQKRLLDFARILAARPSVVLLDEPLAGVNPTLHGSIAAAIDGLRSRGITVVVIEHNLAFIGEVCDHVHVMSMGRCIASGTLEDLQKDPDVMSAYLGEEELGPEDDRSCIDSRSDHRRLWRRAHPACRLDRGPQRPRHGHCWPERRRKVHAAQVRLRRTAPVRRPNPARGRPH